MGYPDNGKRTVAKCWLYGEYWQHRRRIRIVEVERLGWLGHLPFLRQLDLRDLRPTLSVRRSSAVVCMTTRRRCKWWEIYLWGLLVTFGITVGVVGWIAVYQVWLSK